jgi:hypothetical protein
VSLVALLLLAGCMGGLGGTESTSTPEEADLPPGVNESGLQNASALIAGYNETVREEGIVLNATENITYDRYRERRQLHTVLAPGGHPFNTTISSGTYYLDGEPRTEREFTHFWGNESTTLVRSFLTPPTEVTEPFRIRNEPTQARYYLYYLKNANYTTDSVVERDGHTFTTLVANESTNGGALNVQAVVDERGLIHELTMNVVEEGYDAHRTFRLVKTDPSPPEKPDWTANVTDRSPANTTQNRSA